MKPAKLRKLKAARLREEDRVLMEDSDVGQIYSDRVLRIVPAKMEKAKDEKQRPGHLMTITTSSKRFRVLPTADLYIRERETRK